MGFSDPEMDRSASDLTRLADAAERIARALEIANMREMGTYRGTPDDLRFEANSNPTAQAIYERIADRPTPEPRRPRSNHDLLGGE